MESDVSQNGKKNIEQYEHWINLYYRFEISLNRLLVFHLDQSGTEDSAEGSTKEENSRKKLKLNVEQDSVDVEKKLRMKIYSSRPKPELRADYWKYFDIVVDESGTELQFICCIF